jgi:hypothetical protein
MTDEEGDLVYSEYMGHGTGMPRHGRLFSETRLKYKELLTFRTRQKTHMKKKQLFPFAKLHCLAL